MSDFFEHVNLEIKAKEQSTGLNSQLVHTQHREVSRVSRFRTFVAMMSSKDSQEKVNETHVFCSSSCHPVWRRSKFNNAHHKRLFSKGNSLYFI